LPDAGTRALRGARDVHARCPIREKPGEGARGRTVSLVCQGFKSDVYLKKRRERTKAELGVALSAFSPDKVFTTMQELIDSFDWTEFEATDKQFKLLTEI